jgi:hypothetical protein
LAVLSNAVTHFIVYIVCMYMMCRYAGTQCFIGPLMALPDFTDLPAPIVKGLSVCNMTCSVELYDAAVLCEFTILEELTSGGGEGREVCKHHIGPCHEWGSVMQNAMHFVNKACWAQNLIVNVEESQNEKRFVFPPKKRSAF